MPLLSGRGCIRAVVPLPLPARWRGILLACAAPVLRPGSAADPSLGADRAPPLRLQTRALLRRRFQKVRNMRLYSAPTYCARETPCHRLAPERTLNDRQLNMSTLGNEVQGGYIKRIQKGCGQEELGTPPSQ